VASTSQITKYSMIILSMQV